MQAPRAQSEVEFTLTSSRNFSARGSNSAAGSGATGRARELACEGRTAPAGLKAFAARRANRFGQSADPAVSAAPGELFRRACAARLRRCCSRVRPKDHEPAPRACPQVSPVQRWPGGARAAAGDPCLAGRTRPFARRRSLFRSVRGARSACKSFAGRYYRTHSDGARQSTDGQRLHYPVLDPTARSRTLHGHVRESPERMNCRRDFSGAGD